jgi:hypothetical protein
LDEGLKKAKNMGQGLSNSLDAAKAGSFVLLGGVTAVTAGVAAFGALSVKAYSNSEDVVTALNAGLKNMGENVSTATAALQKQATALQSVTRFSDEQILSGDAMLTTFKLSSGTIQKLNPSLLDMAEGLRDVNGQTIGLDEGAKLMGKAMGNAEGGIDGLSSALRRNGIIMTDAQMEIFKTGTEAERAATMVELMSFNFGGRATAAGKTLSGQITILKNVFDDFQELIGKAIADKIKPLVKGFIDWFNAMGGPEGVLRALSKTFQEFAPWIPVVAGAILMGLVPALYAMASGFIAMMAPLIPFLAAGALLGLIVKAIIDHFGGWSNTLKAMQPIFDAMKAGWDALIFVWQTILLPLLLQLWNQITTQLWPALQQLWTLIGPILGPALKGLAILIGVILIAALVVAIGIIGAVVTALTGIVNGINIVINTFRTIDGAIRGALANVYNAIRKPFEDAFNWLWGKVDAVNKQLAKLNPFAKHSPSLVEMITKGTERISDLYGNMFENIGMSTKGFPASISSIVPAASSNSKETNIYGNIQIGSDAQAESFFKRMGTNLELAQMGVTTND